MTLVSSWSLPTRKSFSIISTTLTTGFSLHQKNPSQMGQSPSWIEGLWTCCSRFEECWSKLLRCCSLPLLCGIVLSNVRIGIWQWRPELANGCWNWAHLTLHLQKGLNYLIIVGWVWSLVLQGVHLISCAVWPLLNMCVPCIDVIFTSMSTTSTGSLHLKNPCKKLHSGCSKHAMFIYLSEI